MIALTTMCLLMSGTASDAAPSVFAAPIAVASTLGVAPQGAQDRGKHIKGRGPGPAGGTPEPVSVLLMAGGALGYGFLRLRRGAAGRSSRG